MNICRILILPIGAIGGWCLSKIVPKNTHWSFKPDYRCIVHTVDSEIGCFKNESNIAKVEQNENLLPTVFKDNEGKLYWLDLEDIKGKENIDTNITNIKSKLGSVLSEDLKNKTNISLRIHK